MEVVLVMPPVHKAIQLTMLKDQMVIPQLELQIQILILIIIILITEQQVINIMDKMEEALVMPLDHKEIQLIMLKDHKVTQQLELQILLIVAITLILIIIAHYPQVFQVTKYLKDKKIYIF